MACFASCLEGLLEFVNNFAFVYVAIYGESFMGAAKATANLFNSCALDMIMSWNLTDQVALFGALAAGLANAGVTYGLMKVWPSMFADEAAYVYLWWAGIIGAIMCSKLMMITSGGVI